MGACLTKAKSAANRSKDKAPASTEPAKDAAKDAAEAPAKTISDTAPDAKDAAKTPEQPAADAVEKSDQPDEKAKDDIVAAKHAPAEKPSDTVDAVSKAEPCENTQDAAGEEEVRETKDVVEEEPVEESAVPAPETVEESNQVPADVSAVPVETPAPVETPIEEEEEEEEEEPSNKLIALMAGTLEAVRAGIAECDDVVQSGVLRNFIVSFSDLTLAIKNEMIIEEEAYFPLLDDHFDNIAKDAKLYEAHRADEQLEGKVDAALNKKNLEAATEAFAAWKEHHLAHIDRELDTLGAAFGNLTAKLGGEPDAAVVFNKRILENRISDIAWFVSWNASSLAKHKSFDALAEWVSALQRISTPEQWEELLPEVKTPLSEELRERLRETGCEEPGKIV